MRTEYNKLIRDRIPEIIEADGRTCQIEIMSEAEYRLALAAKLVEEARELEESAGVQDIARELADLCEVMDALIEAHGIDRHGVIALRAARRETRGGFARRLRLLWVDQPTDAQD